MGIDTVVALWYYIHNSEGDGLPNQIQKGIEMTTMTATQTIAIKSINTKPELDPYHRDTQGITRTCIDFDPQERTIIVSQEMDSNSTPMDVWNNHRYQWIVAEWPSETDMRGWLEDNMRRFERIVAGHSIKWDGNNNVGRLTEDAHAAYESITEEIAHIGLGCPPHYEVWSLDLWMEHVEEEARDKSDEQIRDLAEKCMDVDDNIILLFDEDEAYEHLIWFRDEHSDE